MSGHIGTAAAQWFSRPADERFDSWETFHNACMEDARECGERAYNPRDLSVRPTEGGGLMLATPKGGATFNNWSFSQLARTVKAPAGYLASLPAELAANCLNHGIQAATAAGPSDFWKLYARKPQGDGLPALRAVTSDSYTRITDASLYGAAYKLITEQCSRQGHTFHLPTDWTGKPSGAFRGDRDSFLLLVDGGSIVEDPSVQGGNGAMYRGIMLSNSEVGSRSVTIETVLFRWICGNLNLWGAAYDSRFRRRHVGAVDRRAFSEIRDIAWRWSNASADRDLAIVKFMVGHELAETKDGIVRELRALGATEGDARAAYERAEVTEHSPRSLWGISQGLTRISQDHPNMDDRIAVDQIAAALVAKAVKLARV